MKRRKLLLSVLLIAVMGIMTGTLSASPYFDGENTGDESLKQGWNEIGPNNYAGRTRALVFDKFNDGVVYAGTVGGLYVSVNYGKSWEEIALDGAVQNVTAITQGDDGRLYVATGEGFYTKMVHAENSFGYSNQPSGSVGNGVFMQTEGFSKDWANSLQSDEAKFEYVRNSFKFSVMQETKPASKYAFLDDWAYINTILFNDNILYVGTKNGGLKYTSDVNNVNAEFENIRIGGNSSFDVMDILVNKDGKVAVAYTGTVAVGKGTDFNVVFNSSVDDMNPASSFGIGRIKLAFSEKNPNDLFVFVAADFKNVAVNQYQPEINGYIYGIYRPYYTKIPGGTIDENIGVENLQPNSSNWFNVTTSSMSSIAGTSLAYGMSIYVDDRNEQEQLYIGGNSVLVGRDYNGEGRFTFSHMTSVFTEDTLGMNVGINVHNILPMPAKTNGELSMYDSLCLLVSSDMGVFRYSYDSIINSLRWWPAFGMNNLQVYKVSATADGSVVAATQSNSVLYTHRVADSMKRGMKIWSVNNPGYPYNFNSTNTSDRTHSGSSVNASAIYRTTPSIRKPLLLSRPGTNVTRTYSNAGNFDAIDDQTWTYGHTSLQTLLGATMADNFDFDPFNTPIAFWESFDFAGTIDSVEMSITDYTIVRRAEGSFACRNGREILVGDTILVESDNMGYPFFHIMAKTDTLGFVQGTTAESYTLGEGDTIFYKNANLKIKVPQPVQARALVATNTGAFICGKIMDFSRTINPSSAAENKWGNLTWAKLYSTGNASSGDDLSTMNKRIHAVALSQDGSAAFLAVDRYSSYESYDNTILVRIPGLNDVNIADDYVFRGTNNDRNKFTADTIAEFNRPISSIVCDPMNSDNMIITFEGAVFTGANVMQTTNALATSVDFTDISLNINRNNQPATSDKPVFTALYESINAGKTAKSGRIYVGSDDGIYYRENGKWISDNANVPDVAVFNLWQQTKKLPKWIFYSYTGDNAELTTFEATANTGVIYAATYGKGVFVNNDFKDTNAIDSKVSLVDVIDDKQVETLNIYPNPAIDQATIAFVLDVTSNVEFRMFDMNGREVSSFNSGVQTKGNHFQTIDVSRLQSGAYMIQMFTKDSVKSAKLIVK